MISNLPMPDKIYDIFVSYRRIDSEGRTSGRDIARTIKLEFEKRGYAVFFDYSEIKDDEFERTIIPAVESAKVFILVLSKDALVRCANEGDWVRREIETALHSGCKIIPVNPDGAFNGWPSNLPENILPLTKQEISEVFMGSLFEKSIDKIEEERFGDVFPHKRTPKRLRFSSYFFLYIVFSLICCSYCAKSLHLITGMNAWMIWFCMASFWGMLSVGIKNIAISFNPVKHTNYRIIKYIFGVVTAIIIGVLFVAPIQTHALYYNFVVKDEIRTDINQTKKYLSGISEGESIPDVETAIAQIEGVEREIVYGKLNLGNRSDMLKVDSVLSEGYAIIRNHPETKYNNIEDEIRYTAEEPTTRIATVMSIPEVWKLQLQNGFSKEFLLALVIAMLLSASAMVFLLLSFFPKEK